MTLPVTPNWLLMHGVPLRSGSGSQRLLPMKAPLSGTSCPGPAEQRVPNHGPHGLAGMAAGLAAAYCGLSDGCELIFEAAEAGAMASRATATPAPKGVGSFLM